MRTNGLSKFIRTLGAATKRHAPEILTGVGILGWGTATVLAVRATPKAMKSIEEKKEELNVDSLTPVETVQATWKHYIPAAGTAIAASICLTKSTSVSIGRTAAFATLAKVSETTLSDYKDKMIEVLGEKKAAEVRDKVAQKQVDRLPVRSNEIFITEKGNTIILEPLTNRYFKSDADTIRRIVNDLNAEINYNMSVSLTDFNNKVGLPHADIADIIGWNADHPLSITFSAAVTSDDQPCLVIDWLHEPRHEFDRLY